MKPTSLIVIAFLGALSPVGRVASAREPTEGERTLLAEAFALHAALADSVWPGWGETSVPLVLVSGDAEYGIGFPRPLDGAETVAPLGGRSVCARPRTFAPNLAASFFVEGVPASILGTPEAIGASPTLWLGKAQHEMFHVLQLRRGSVDKVAALEIGPKDDASWQLTYPFPYDSDEVMAAVHTLGYCLWVAMTSESDADGNYAAGTAEDARVALEALLRRATGDEKAYRYARFQMQNEGVALWTEREIVRRAAAGEYRPSSAFLALPGAVPFEQVWSETYENTPFLVKHAGRAARSRQVFYHLGFGFASVLERLDPAWRTRTFDPDVWVDGMLAGAVTSACEVPPAP